MQTQTQKQPHQYQPINTAGAICALLATIMWSGNFIVARGMALYVPPLTLGFLRWLMAFIILLPFCYKDFAAAWPVFKAHWLYYVLTSLTGVSLFTVFMYYAAVTTSVLNMTLIATSSPVFTIILARIFIGEKLTAGRIIGIIAAIAGDTLLAVRGRFGNLLSLEFHLGDLLVLVSAMLFAINNIQLRFKPKGPSLSAFIFLMSALGAIVALPLMLGELALGAKPLIINTTVVLNVVYLGLFASVGGFWFWNKAIASMGPGNSALFYYSLPFFSGLGAVLLLGEPVLWVHFASGVLIIAGIVIATRC